MSRWWIVAVGFVCLLGEAVGTYTFAPMLKPIVEELGWTRTQFTLSGLFLGLVMMAGVPLAGVLTDRGYARLVLASGALCLGGAMYLFSLMRSLGEFYLITAFMGLGVGCLGGIPITALVSRWFEKRRGFAMAAAGLGHSVGGLILPPAVTWIAAGDGWRAAFRALAYLLWVLVLPAILVFVRDAPSHLRVPDRADAIGPAGERIRLAAGMYSRPFGLLAAAMFLHTSYFSGVTVHFVAFATDVGFSAQAAATAFGTLLGLGILGRIGFGSAADRFHRKTVLVAALLLTVAAALLLQWITAPAVLPLFVLVQGVSVAGVQTLFGLLVADVFGALNAGTFLGATMLFQVPGGVLGAIAAAESFDRLGTYRPAFWLFAAGNLVAALAVTAVRPFARR